MRGRVVVCGSLVRVVNTVLALVQATHRLTFEKTSSWRVVICAYNESRHTYSVSKTSLGVAMARCGERMRTDRITLTFIPSSEKPQPETSLVYASASWSLKSHSIMTKALEETWWGERAQSEIKGAKLGRARGEWLELIWFLLRELSEGRSGWLEWWGSGTKMVPPPRMDGDQIYKGMWSRAPRRSSAISKSLVHPALLNAFSGCVSLIQTPHYMLSRSLHITSR